MEIVCLVLILSLFVLVLISFSMLNHVKEENKELKDFVLAKQKNNEATFKLILKFLEVSNEDIDRLLEVKNKIKKKEG